jgi:DNA-binding NtrC family response regulator
VQAVDNATLALAAITQNKPDAILLDVRLPEVDGLSVLKSLPEMEVRAPIFVMTGYDSTPVAIEARARVRPPICRSPLT